LYRKKKRGDAFTNFVKFATDKKRGTTVRTTLKKKRGARGSTGEKSRSQFSNREG